MNLTHQIQRALLLALLLPALLVPSGWSLRLCFCAAMSGQTDAEQTSCCAKREAPSCCDESSPAQPAGDHRECGDCKQFGTDNRSLPPTLASAPDVPVALAFDAAPWTLPEVLEVVARANCIAQRAHAPPGLEPAPPLRI